MKRLLVIGIILGISCSAAWADEAPPIHRLPKDLAHLATVWVAVPETVYRVSHDEGPLAGVTKGSVTGGRQMISDAVTYLTSGYFHGSRSQAGQPAGTLVTYSF